MNQFNEPQKFPMHFIEQELLKLATYRYFLPLLFFTDTRTFYWIDICNKSNHSSIEKYYSFQINFFTEQTTLPHKSSRYQDSSIPTVDGDISRQITSPFVMNLLRLDYWRFTGMIVTCEILWIYNTVWSINLEGVEILSKGLVHSFWLLKME